MPMIEIKGCVGTGKTTLSEIISQALIEKGFKVKIRDIDGIQHPLPEEFLDLAIPAMIEKFGEHPIQIVETQLQRESIYDKPENKEPDWGKIS